MKKAVFFFVTVFLATIPFSVAAFSLPNPLGDAGSLVKVFGGKIESILPAGPTCPLKMIKVGGPAELDKGIIFNLEAVDSVLKKIVKIPVVGGGVKGIRKLLKTISPTMIYDIGEIGFFEWAVGKTWPKAVTKPIFEALTAVGIVCDSDAFVVRIIGTSAGPALR